MLLRTVAVWLVLLLTGCSSTYDIRAVVIGGKLAFVPASTNIWGNPDCIYSISVREVEPRPSRSEVGGSSNEAANATYWDKSFAFTSCENPFPIFYASKLKGPPWRDLERYAVEAKPLRVGVTYEVTTSSEGSAYGSGRFQITEERKVVNLPL